MVGIRYSTVHMCCTCAFIEALVMHIPFYVSLFALYTILWTPAEYVGGENNSVFFFLLFINSADSIKRSNLVKPNPICQ